MLLHIKESLKATYDQLIKFQIGEGNGVFLEGTLLQTKINTYFPHELAKYKTSLQNKKNFIFLSWYNKVLLTGVILSLITLFVLTIKTCQINKELFAIILILLSGILINAWACGTLANAINRLGTKVIWLIPLITLIGSINYLDKEIPTNKNI